MASLKKALSGFAKELEIVIEVSILGITVLPNIMMSELGIMLTIRGNILKV
jgi:hypothetical protein